MRTYHNNLRELLEAASEKYADKKAFIIKLKKSSLKSYSGFGFRPRTRTETTH